MESFNKRIYAVSLDREYDIIERKGVGKGREGTKKRETKRKTVFSYDDITKVKERGKCQVHANCLSIRRITNCL